MNFVIYVAVKKSLLSEMILLGRLEGSIISFPYKSNEYIDGVALNYHYRLPYFYVLNCHEKIFVPREIILEGSGEVQGKFLKQPRNINTESVFSFLDLSEVLTTIATFDKVISVFVLFRPPKFLRNFLRVQWPVYYGKSLKSRIFFQ